MTQRYIFIVGSSRTGTSELRNVLNCSEDVAICDETHFFGGPKTVANLLRNILNGSKKVASWGENLFLGQLSVPGLRQELAEIGDISTDVGAKKIVDYIYDNCWRWAPKDVERDAFLRKLLESDRSDRALFNLAMAYYANGKPIRGEKTPAHIHYVPIILEWFPNAKFIHTLRDPRTIFILHKKKPLKGKRITWSSRIARQSALISEIYLSLDIISTWLRVMQLHHQYQQHYPNNYYYLKNEDLVSDPRTQLKKLCRFLEIEFTEKMLQHALQTPNLGPCAQIQANTLALATDCWRKHLHPLTNKWFVLLCKKHLLEFGYSL